MADPANLTVNISGTTASLDWDTSPTADVEDYEVFRRTPPTGAAFDPFSDTPVQTGVTATNWDDTGLTRGLQYEWQVFAHGYTDAGAAWSPLDLPNLVAWWDASDTATITESGGNVSQWDDKCAANHWVQGTGANQPDTGTRTMNGLNVIDFNGSSDTMTCATWMGAKTAGTFFVVFLSDTLTTGAFFAGSSMSNAGGSSHEPYNDGNVYEAFGTNARKSYAKTAAWDQGASHIYNVIAAASDFRAYLDNTNLHTTATNTVSFNSSVTINLAQDAAKFDGVIAEMFFTDTAISDPDRTSAYGYLKAKWGTP